MRTFSPTDGTPIAVPVAAAVSAPVAPPVAPTTDATVDGIIARFRAAYRELRCVGSERMLRQGLSMAHLHAMSLLERHGEMPMSGLAEVLDVSLSNTTGLVDRMEERGLVERHRVPGDRRVVMVRITDRGKATLAEADVLKEELLRSILGALDPPRLERLAAALEDVREAIEAGLSSAAASEWHEHAHRYGHAHGGDQRPEPAA